jgi:D-alanyl-D-alanine carboxypeptidase/D-alanyl-D-alanine-endopeptidase (penicillin-binding protein 4)
MMVNDYPGRAGPVVQGLDAIGAAVAATGSSLGPDKAVAQVLVRENALSSMDELKTRMSTFLGMAKGQDAKKQAFLRTAWRTERDPAVRAVVADALYQANVQDYLARRALLESWTATDDVYGRLRKVAKDLNISVPGVASVLDLAAEGDADALERAVELVRPAAAAQDATTVPELQEGLAQAARTAPEELLYSLQHALSTDREAAVASLARGFVQMADASHPFWPALQHAAGLPDAATAAFAKDLEVKLSLRIAELKAPPPGPAATPAPPPLVAPRPPSAPPQVRPGG